MPKLYTKYGDRGETGLLYGGRVPKTDTRVEAYGTVDEAVAALGLARALSTSPRVKEIILEIQRALFTVAAELATAPSHYETFKTHFRPTTPEMTAEIEQTIDALSEEVQLPRSFVIPGRRRLCGPGHGPVHAAAGGARVAGMKEEGLLATEEDLRYLNRVADLLFLLARYEDRALPPELLTGQGR